MSEVILRAMTVGELLDKAFRIYRSKFAVLIGIMAAVLIPESIVMILLILYLPPQLIQLNVLVSSFLQIFSTLALVECISRVYLQKAITLKESYALGLRRFWPVLGANIVIGLAIVIPMVILAFLPVVGACFVLLFIPVVFYVSTKWSLSTPAIVLENLGASEGLKRSFKLTQDHFWRVFGTSFAAGLLVSLISALPNYVFTFLFMAMEVDSQTIQIFNLFLSQVATLIANPFSIAVTVLIYYDLRIRKEGFDLQVLAEGSNTPIVSTQ